MLGSLISGLVKETLLLPVTVVGGVIDGASQAIDELTE